MDVYIKQILVNKIILEHEHMFDISAALPSLLNMTFHMVQDYQLPILHQNPICSIHPQN
jgi:hypothetical protein